MPDALQRWDDARERDRHDDGCDPVALGFTVVFVLAIAAALLGRLV